MMLIGGDTGESRPATAGCEYNPTFGWWSGKRPVRLGVAVDTLLGPEGTSFCLLLLANRSRARLPPAGGVPRTGDRGWPLFENCTVDASIFVVKLPRANGECLGTRSR